jgi:atypical dual specificity phosphatase
MGISRSPTVICAYLVATTNMSATESVRHVQAIRTIVYPNFGFRRQLEQYSTQIPKPETESDSCGEKV